MADGVRGELPPAPELRPKVAGDRRVEAGIKNDSHDVGHENPNRDTHSTVVRSNGGIVQLRTRLGYSDRQAVVVDKHGSHLSGLATIGRVRTSVVSAAGSFHTEAIDAEMSQDPARWLGRGPRTRSARCVRTRRGQDTSCAEYAL